MQKKQSIQENAKNQYKINIHELFQSIFSEVIVRCFFGAQPKQTIDGKNIYTFMNKMIADIALESRSALYFLFGNIAASRKLKKDLVQIGRAHV